MNLKFRLCTIAFSFLILGNFYAFSQTDTNSTSITRSTDTVCFKYSFEKGDTLTYSIVSMDSIAINFGAPLIKSRNELLMVVCDSVSTRGSFFLTLELIDYVGFENYGASSNKEIKETPWKGRSVQIEIDSLGKRLSWSVDDSTKGAMSTGGAFQPYLFFWFKESCKIVDETWMVQSMDELPENGIPVPAMNQSTLFRARKNLDTLNEKCSSFEFIKTGQGSVRVNDGKTSMLVSSIINSFGVLDISIEKKIPVHFYYTVEQKLTIQVAPDDKQQGWHYITSNFTLHQFKKLDMEAVKRMEAEKARKELLKKGKKKK